ncbi:hypothetical protein L0Y34_02420, partial [Candidatus Parcubacteria bacterium]|nr:hypothetical protein [Candidatus Parcubacteria bacterium]
IVARSLVLPEPNFEDYCPVRVMATTVGSCENQGGVWVADENMAPKTVPGGYCDFYSTCQPLFDDAHKNYQLYSFVILVGLGVLALIVGVIPLGSSIVSTGLSYGGVLALIIAALGYWDSAGTLLKLAMSLIALAALIYVGIRRFKD